MQLETLRELLNMEKNSEIIVTNFERGHMKKNLYSLTLEVITPLEDDK